MNFFMYTIFQMKYATCSTTVFISIMTTISKSAIFFLSMQLSSTLFVQMQQILLCCSFVNGIIFFLSKIITFTACLIRIHKTFSCNLRLCSYHVDFLYHQISLLRTQNIKRECILVLLLWIIFQNSFYISPFFN